MITEHLSRPGIIPKQPNGFKFWHLKEHAYHLQCCRVPVTTDGFWAPNSDVQTTIHDHTVERWPEWIPGVLMNGHPPCFPWWAHRWEARWHLMAIPIITGNTQRDPLAVILQECTLYVESRLGLQDNTASTPEAQTPLSHSKQASA